MFFLTTTILLLLLTATGLFMWGKLQKKADAKRAANEYYDQNNVSFWKVGTAVCVALQVVIYFFNAVLIVERGHAVPVDMFGAVVENKVYKEGPHLINPLYSRGDYSVQRIEIEFSGDARMETLTKGSLKVVIDASVPYSLNSKWIWWLYQNVPSSYDMIYNNARTAFRSSANKYDGKKLNEVETRNAYINDVTKNMMTLLENDLQAMNAPMKAKDVFRFAPIKLRKVEPPKAVADAAADKAASEIELQRQNVLDDIAGKVATRRTKEGRGFKNLFRQLPSRYTGDDIAKILSAMADKTRADSVMMLSKKHEGNIDTVVVDAGKGSNIAIPASK
jgi:regulator of protease activity HflC (stomatin/prohibitin superfamily)